MNRSLATVNRKRKKSQPCRWARWEKPTGLNLAIREAFVPFLLTAQGRGGHGIVTWTQVASGCPFSQCPRPLGQHSLAHVRLAPFGGLSAASLAG